MKLQLPVATNHEPIRIQEKTSAESHTEEYSPDGGQKSPSTATASVSVSVSVSGSNPGQVEYPVARNG